MSRQNKKSNPGFAFKRILLIVTLLFIILAAALGTFFYFNIEEITKTRLTGLINEKLAPNAEIEISEFEIDYYPLGAAFRGIRLIHQIPFYEIEPKSTADAIRNLEIDEISVSDIKIFRFLFGDKWRIGQVEINGLTIELTPAPEEEPVEATHIVARPDIRINQILINNSNIYYYRERLAQDAAAIINNMNIKLDRFIVPDTGSHLHDFFDDIILETSAIKFSTGNGNYELEAESFLINSHDGILQITGGKSHPLKTSAEMAMEAGRPKDKFNISFDEFLAEGILIEDLLSGDDFYSNRILLSKPGLAIRRDRTLPRPDREDRLLPAVQFKSLPFPVSVDSLFVTDGYISYGEEYMDEDREGIISFYNIEMAMSKLNNRLTDDSIRVAINAQFMDLAPLMLKASFALDEKGTHSVEGHLGELDLTVMNPTIEGFIAMRVSSGIARSIDFAFLADDDVSYGMLTFIYNDLEIRFMEAETLRERRRDRLRSFIANRFVVRSNNPAEDPRNAAIDFERDKQRSMFNYWWKSISDGLMESIRR
jgi:hypothetical protein